MGVQTGRGGRFGELLRAHRLVAGLTQEELAGLSGLSTRTVADIERGQTARPYRRSVALLADALGLVGADRLLFARVARPGIGAGGAAGRPEPAGAALVASAPVIPRQLPAAVPCFTGRKAELAALSGLLQHGAKAGGTVVVSAVGGTAGVGKTALAVHWGHRVAHLFPDGQLYADLRGFGPAGAPVTPAEAVRFFLEALGVMPGRIPASPDAQAALYRSLLAERRVLIVLDNARDPAQVRPLLPGCPGCLVLVTSRRLLTGLAVAEGARLLTLDVLSGAEAQDLLASRLGGDRVTAEPAAVRELIRLCARLPLALAIAAARAAARPGLPLVALAAELRSIRGRLDGLDTEDAATDVRTVFSWSCRQLSESSARMFRLLGLHPGPDISTAAAASLAGIPPGLARQALAELARAHLVTEPSPGRFACHDLLRAYAAEQAASQDTETAGRAAVRRVLDHYLHTASAASVLLHPDRTPVTLPPLPPLVRPEKLADHEQALAWFQAERQVMLATISQASQDALGAHAWLLPWSMATYLHWHGYWHELTTTQEHALAAARRLGDLVGQAHSHHFIGQAKIRLGDYAQAAAHLSAALELGRQLDSNGLQARAHLDLGRACDLQGLGLDAAEHARQALRLYRAAGLRTMEANALNAVGWSLAQLGRHQEAVDYTEQALALHRELGNQFGAATTLDSLGYAHHCLGHHAEAIDCYQQALAGIGDIGDRRDRAEIIIHLGDAQQAARNPEAAGAAWHQALAILDDLQDPAAAGVRSRLAAAQDCGS